MLNAFFAVLLVGTIFAYLSGKFVKNSPIKLSGFITSILMLVFFTGAVGVFETVKAGNLGVLTTFGKVKDIKNPGLVFRIPLVQDVIHITTQPIQVDDKIPVNENGAITKDNQTVGSDLTFFYKYVPERMKEVYEKYGTERLANIIKTSGKECLKSELGNHAIFIIPMSQAQIQKNVIEALRSKMSEYPVEITELKILNYDWSDVFDAQIEQTMKKAQEVKAKQQELLIAEQEAQKAVKTAEANKQANITEAEGEKESARLRADAKALEGEGIRKYNKSVQANMALEVKLRQLEIEKIKAERWNGQYVPTNNYGPIPIETGSIHK